MPRILDPPWRFVGLGSSAPRDRMPWRTAAKRQCERTMGQAEAEAHVADGGDSYGWLAGALPVLVCCPGVDGISFTVNPLGSLVPSNPHSTARNTPDSTSSGQAKQRSSPVKPIRRTALPQGHGGRRPSIPMALRRSALAGGPRLLLCV